MAKGGGGSGAGGRGRNGAGGTRGVGADAARSGFGGSRSMFFAGGGDGFVQRAALARGMSPGQADNLARAYLRDAREWRNINGQINYSRGTTRRNPSNISNLLDRRAQIERRWGFSGND